MASQDTEQESRPGNAPFSVTFIVHLSRAIFQMCSSAHCIPALVSGSTRQKDAVARIFVELGLNPPRCEQDTSSVAGA